MSDRQRQAPGGGGGGRRRRRRLREPRKGEGDPQQSPQRENQSSPRKNRERGGRGDRPDRHRGGGRPAREREPRLEYTSVISLPEDKSAACALCGKPVRDAVAALCYGEDRLPAHFDCVVAKLQTEKQLGSDERLCYLGGGNFGVVRSPQGEGKVPFSIRDREQYESGQERPDWRRVLDAIASRKKPAPPPFDPPA